MSNEASAAYERTLRNALFRALKGNHATLMTVEEPCKFKASVLPRYPIFEGTYGPSQHISNTEVDL